MKFISTRGGQPPLAFSETVLAGLARDGGLFLPNTIPDLRAKLSRLNGGSYAGLAYNIIRPFAKGIPEPALRGIIDRSYAKFDHWEVTPVTQAGPVHILELFHGPTLAFKDLALQFLGNLFEHILAKKNTRLNIVAATSGDTGSAAIHGLRGRKNIRVFVLHPHLRTSPAQALQMTTVLDSNVHNIAIQGTFDDCQAIVKDLFNDLAFRDANHLGAVNSINFARILAQIVYYFYAAFRVMDETKKDRVRFTVPTGNFGDIFAGYLAARMGLPIDRLVCASNENDILHRFFQTGKYEAAGVQPTLSPSMDIQISSNFERYLYYRAGGNPALLSDWMRRFKATSKLDISKNNSSVGNSVLDIGHSNDCMASGRGDTADTLATIRHFWDAHRYLLDPHTAVGVHVA
ncbi:MAG: threonine synthase, partial [Kiritimatiellaeota bacterium]|nr:threonine synthase [Kiritimatiellota bacterium]